MVLGVQILLTILAWLVSAADDIPNIPEHNFMEAVDRMDMNQLRAIGDIIGVNASVDTCLESRFDDAIFLAVQRGDLESLHYLSKHMCLELVKPELDYDLWWEALSWAYKHDRIYVIKWIFHRQLLGNLTDIDIHEELVTAMENENYELVRFFLLFPNMHPDLALAAANDPLDPFVEWLEGPAQWLELIKQNRIGDIPDEQLDDSIIDLIMDPLSFGLSLDAIRHALFVLRERYVLFSAPDLHQLNDQLCHRDLANVASFVDDLIKARERLDSFHAPVGRSYMSLIVTDRKIEELANDIYETQNRE